MKITTIKNFFMSCFPDKKISIKKIEKIDLGVTNDIYKVTLENDNIFKLRISNYNKYIDRKLEKKLEKKIFKDDIFYYDEKGNYIKKWLNGKSPNKKNLNNDFWKKIIEKIEEFHSLTIENYKIPEFEYFPKASFIYTNFIEEFKLYKEIIDDFIREENNVLSHNDFSLGNIIYNNNQLNIIDFEWSTKNHKYWDIGNLIKDIGLNIEEVDEIKEFSKLSKEEFIKIIYATHFYTLIWTFLVEENKKIINYRNVIISRTNYWFNVINNKINW